MTDHSAAEIAYQKARFASLAEAHTLLERRVAELEMENRQLRTALVFADDELIGKQDSTEMWVAYDVWKRAW